MQNHKDNIKEISDIQSYLSELYKDVNSNYHWDYLFGYLVNCTGFMSATIMSVQKKSTPFIKGISWLFAIANQKNIDVADVYMQKYPGVCYYCLAAPCKCYKTNKMPSYDIPAYRLVEERQAKYQTIKNTTLINNQWLKGNIETIYPGNEIIWSHSGPWFHFAKLLEELGELHQILGKHEIGEDSLENLEQEIADVFAWIVNIFYLAFPQKKLEEEIIDFYYYGCPICKRFPCKCSQHMNSRQGVVNIAELTNLRDKLMELNNAVQDKDSTISSLLTSVDKAIKDKNEPLVLQAVKQTQDKVSGIESALDVTDEATKKIANISTSIVKIASKILTFANIF